MDVDADIPNALFSPTPYQRFSRPRSDGPSHALLRTSSFLDLENLLLQPVPLGKNLFPPLPSVPRPPPQFLTERYRRQRRTAFWSLLKRIALVAITLLEKSLIQVIVEPIS